MCEDPSTMVEESALLDGDTAGSSPKVIAQERAYCVEDSASVADGEASICTAYPARSDGHSIFALK
jgi:hypothetical protein